MRDSVVGSRFRCGWAPLISSHASFKERSGGGDGRRRLSVGSSLHPHVHPHYRCVCMCVYMRTPTGIRLSLAPSSNPPTAFSNPILLPSISRSPWPEVNNRKWRKYTLPSAPCACVRRPHLRVAGGPERLWAWVAGAALPVAREASRIASFLKWREARDRSLLSSRKVTLSSPSKMIHGNLHL